MTPAPPLPRTTAGIHGPGEWRAERDGRLAAWLESASQGDARAFEAFYDATVGYAQALARRIVAAADIEDVLSDAYFQAWREAAQFDAGRGSAVTWLLTRVRSRALDLLRHRRSLQEAELSDAEAPDDRVQPEDLIALVEAGGRLQRALSALSASERWVLGLAYYRELSHAAIAAATGMPLGTVKSLIQRAQAKLRSLLNAGPGGPTSLQP